MMYEELVKRLRYDTELLSQDGWAAGLFTEAADAIEELQQTVKHYKGCSDDWYKEACDYKAMLPRWIPVTERLPENDGRYLVCNQPYKAQWVMIQEYWKDSGLSGSSVTHWMPLPEPPKEEREDADS